MRRFGAHARGSLANKRCLSFCTAPHHLHPVRPRSGAISDTRLRVSWPSFASTRRDACAGDTPRRGATLRTGLCRLEQIADPPAVQTKSDSLEKVVWPVRCEALRARFKIDSAGEVQRAAAVEVVVVVSAATASRSGASSSLVDRVTWLSHCCTRAQAQKPSCLSRCRFFIS